MKIVYHSAFIRKELERNSVYYAIPGKAYIEVEKDKDDIDCKAIFNGKLADAGTSRFEFYLDAELTICQCDENYTYFVKHISSPISNKYALSYEQFMYEYEDKTENEIDSIKKGSLKIYAVDKSIEVNDWTDIFDEIEKAFSSFKIICEKPKSHLKSVNEIRPIETVKRIGYESIPYLAAHSEDWLAKTASGLKPARLFSRVEDDEYHIYENRVVKTLIDLIILFLRKQEKELKDKNGQLDEIMSSSVKTESFGFDVTFQRAVTELMSSDEKGYEYWLEALDFGDKLHTRAQILLKKYRSLRQTRMYRYLKNAKPVTNPLNETNILLMDKNYNATFKLWKSIHKALSPIKVSKENVVEFKYTCSDYMLFCKVLCGYTAHALNFDIINDGHYFRSKDNLELSINETNDLIHISLKDKTKRFLQISNVLQVPIAAETNEGKFSYDGTTLYWENDVTLDEIEAFCALFKTRGSRGKVQADEKKKYNALKVALNQRQREYMQPKHCELLLVPAAVELENGTRNKFKNYVLEQAKLLSAETGIDNIIVALPLCNAGEQKVIEYAKNEASNVMLLPLTMFDINSFRRLQNVFLRMILTFDDTVCPCCGSKTRVKGDGQYICDNCNQLVITHTTCPNCKHQYSYLNYDVSRDTIKRMIAVEKNNFYQVDSLYQYKDVVQMSLLNNQVRSVCPHCNR